MATPPEISPDSVRHYGSGYEAAARQACRELENETRRYSAEAASRVAVDSFMQELIANPDGPQKLGSRLEQQNITPDPRELYMQTPDCRPSPVVTIVFPKSAKKQYSGAFWDKPFGKADHQYQPGLESDSRKALRALDEDVVRASVRYAQESQATGRYLPVYHGVLDEEGLSEREKAERRRENAMFFSMLEDEHALEKLYESVDSLHKENQAKLAAGKLPKNRRKREARRAAEASN
jgi:hypothetical protein